MSQRGLGSHRPHGTGAGLIHLVVGCESSLAVCLPPQILLFYADVCIVLAFMKEDAAAKRITPFVTFEVADANNSVTSAFLQ